MERPRIKLITARVSPMVELARWLLERSRIPYSERPHAPILHVLATRWAGGGVEIPVAVTPEGLWDGARNFVIRLDAKLPSREAIFSGVPATRDEEIDFVDRLFGLMLRQVRRYVYFQLLPYPNLVKPVATDGAPLIESLFVRLLYPLWRKLMARGLDFTPDLVAQAPLDIAQAFDLVAERLQSRRYLGGDAPCGLDIIFAALAAPVVFPAEYGAKLPETNQLPSQFRSYLDTCRAHPAGQLVLRVYTTARGTPQELLKFRRPSREFVPPGLTRRALAVLRALTPVFRIGNFALVLRHEHVSAVLSNDFAFRIAPVNRDKIAAVSGEFILGMDRSPQLAKEREIVYGALGKTPISEIVETARLDAESLLRSAIASSGLIDVVNGYARPLAARTAVRLFGIPGPTESDLMRVARAMFHETFLNISGKLDINARAVAAGGELKQWIGQEIARRRSGGIIVPDFLGQLLAMGLDDDIVTRNVAGMLVGSIDTTATAVANVIEVALARPSLLSAMQSAVGNRRKLLGLCYEALRFRPHNPLVQRQAGPAAVVAGKSVAPGAMVWAMTLSAMHDESAFPRSGIILDDRPLDRYFHFGGGLHRCAGLDANVRQIPNLVGALVALRPRLVSDLRFDGPFPDELVVALQGR